MAVTRETLRLVRALRVDIGTEVDAVARTLTGAWGRAWEPLASPWATACDLLVARAVDHGHDHPTLIDLPRVPEVIAALDASHETLTRLAALTATTAGTAVAEVIDADRDREPVIIASQAPRSQREDLHTLLRSRVTEQDPPGPPDPSGPSAGAASSVIVQAVTRRTSPAALAAILLRTRGKITADTWPLSDEATTAMRTELVRGIVVGDNPRTAAARMVERVQHRFNGGLTRALNIARTEMLDAYRSASSHIHRANSDVVQAWQWYAELDDRTCIACWSEHGNTYPLSDPGPDDHQQGRCTRLPVLASWTELGIDAPEPPSEVRSGQDVFRSLSPDRQERIMGPGRYALWSSGQVEWGDLSTRRANPGWRDSVAPRTVRELQAIADSRT